jgi:hypothetical protein
VGFVRQFAITGADIAAFTRGIPDCGMGKIILRL